MLRSIGKQYGGFVSWRRNRGLRWEGLAEKESFKPEMKEWGVVDDESGESIEPMEEVPLKGRRTAGQLVGSVAQRPGAAPRF